MPNGSRYATIDASPLSSDVWARVQPMRLVKNYRAKQDPQWAGMMMKVANGTYSPATRLKDVVGGSLIDLSTYVPPSRIYHRGEETEAIKAIFGEDLQASCSYVFVNWQVFVCKCAILRHCHAY